MSIRKVVPIEQAEWQIAPTPDWVVPREPDWAFTPPPEHPIAFLLIDEQHHVAAQAVSNRAVRRMFTLAAVQALGQAEIVFDPAAHRLTLHELAVWRQGADGVWEKRSLARRETFLLRQREQGLEQQMLNGHVSLVALMEDLRVGDAIDLAWTLEPRDPLPGLRFTAYHAFIWAAPVARAFFTLHRSPAAPAHWKMHALDGVPRPEEEITPELATWTMTRPPIAVPEPNTPGHYWPCALLDISGWNSWSEVADFVATLWADALAEGEETVAAEAARLRAEHSPVDAILAAIRHVQEGVRYLAVDFGHGAGMLPNGAGIVGRRRFGDCKDKSVLLTALLRQLGVEAWPLLVAPNWRIGLDRVLPSTNAFSHAIVTFLWEGKRYFIDPTVIGQGGDLEHLVPPPYARGLEVRSGAEGLLTLPERALAELTFAETFHLHRKRREEGAVEQVLHATNWIADDLRAVLVRGGKSAFFKGRIDELKTHFPAVVPKEEATEVIDNVANNAIELRARHGLPTWGPAGEGAPPDVFRYGAHGLFLAVEHLEGPQDRKQPWMLRHPLRVRHRVVVRGKAVRKCKPERHRFQGPGFRYSCDVTSRSHEVTFDYCWETTQNEVAASEWPAYCRERSRALAHAGANVATPPFLRRPRQPASVSAIVLLIFLVIGIIGRMSDAPRGPSYAPPPRTYYTPATPIPSAGSGDRLRELVREGVARMQAGDKDGAVAIAEQMQNRYPDHPSTLGMVAETAAFSGRNAEAAQAFRKWINARPHDAAPLTAYGAFLHKTGRVVEARRVFADALAEFPDNGRLWLAYSRFLEATGDSANANAARDKARKFLPPAEHAAAGL